MNKKIKVLIFGLPLIVIALVGNFLKNSTPYWNALPSEGLISGDYYRVEKSSPNGKKAVLEGVINNGKIVRVEYNEISGENSSSRYYQGISKRLSEYNFHMAEEEGVSWAEVIIDIERQIIEKQSLSGEFDIIAGCTHSVENSMLPLLKELEGGIKSPPHKKYYGITKNFGGGIYGNLQVILENNKIISCRYDELLASDKKDILYKDLKEFYRQSKYNSVEYSDFSGTGFNVQMDELNNKVVSTQNLLDIEGLPSTIESDDGYKKRNPAWDNYIILARILSKEIDREEGYDTAERSN